MNTNFITLGGGNYVTPEIKLLEIMNEGVLCGSYYYGGGGAYEDGDINDNGEY